MCVVYVGAQMGRCVSFFCYRASHPLETLELATGGPSCILHLRLFSTSLRRVSEPHGRGRLEACRSLALCWNFPPCFVTLQGWKVPWMVLEPSRRFLEPSPDQSINWVGSSAIFKNYLTFSHTLSSSLVFPFCL